MLAVAFAGAAQASAAAPTLDGFSGPRAIRTVDLAGPWDFQPGGREKTTMEVPGGGWYKQGFTDVGQATYTRRVEIPDLAPGQVTRLEFGATNHEATLFVDGTKIGTNTTSFLPSIFDLTGHVRPGATHEIKLDVKGRDALAMGGPSPSAGGFGGPRYPVPGGAEWCEAIPQGIFRSAKLRVFPALHIADAQVKTSTAKRTLTYDVWIRNAAAKPMTTSLTGALRSWNRARWRYPKLPAQRLTVGAGKTEKVTVGPVRWRPGQRSWWWPNVPYRAGYRAQLHTLNLALRRGRRAAHRAAYRFGFREFRQAGTHYELNGIRANLRGDSIQGAHWDRVENGGKGDGFGTFPGFLPPSAANPGWPKAVDNYQRLNHSVLRTHQIPPTPYMLDVTDEQGLMIIDETAIRGSESRQEFKAGRENFVNHVRDLVLRDRNHPSVIRWSQANEPDANDTDSLEFEQELYGTVMAHDDTRPVSVDVTSETYEEMKQPNFSVFQHYVNSDGTIAPGYTDDVHARSDRPFGRGEFIWPYNTYPQGFTWFSTATEKMREKSASDIRPYTLAGAWAGVIPGTKSTDFTTDNHHAHPLYGEDNLADPWSHPQIRLMQRAFNPLLVADRDYWEHHKLSDAAGEWPTPTRPVTLRAGEKSRRTLIVFNDTFEGGDEVSVRWEAREGAADGPVLEQGSFTAEVKRGWIGRREIEFTPKTPGKRLYLTITAAMPGFGEVFREDNQYFEVA